MANSSNWMDNWLESQQKYWNSWADMAQRSMRMPEAPKNPLAEGLNQWWQAVSPMTPPTGREMFDRLMDVSKGYYSLAERFMSGAQTNKDGGMDAINGWLEGMQKMWSDWSQAGANFRPDSFFPKDQFKGLTTFWDLPMDTWNRLASNVMPMPGDFTKAFQPGVGSQPMQEQMTKFLSIPAVGYTREAQEQYQVLAQLQMDYMSAMQAYQTAFGKLGMETTKGFQQSLMNRAKDAQPISSLRELYDQWVEMSEAAYAEFVMTQEYQALYGRLVNSLLALKQQMARMVDQTLEAMHMPTHAEISTLQCRQQELRRDNLKLKKEIKGLQSQIDALRNAMLQGDMGEDDDEEEAKPAARTASKSAAKPASTKRTTAAKTK